jgi:nucleoside-diphosphate-sugar epimerase
MKPLLITGAQGFLGRYCVAEALRGGETVVGFGRSPRNDPIAGMSSPAYEYRSGDVLDGSSLAGVIRETRPRAIVHLASALRFDEPQRLVRTNVAGTIALFDAIADAKAAPERVVLGSSSAVYGRVEKVPVSERAPCRPTDVYGVTKLAAEQLAEIRSRELGIPIYAARIFNLVGPGQDEHHVCGRFAAQAVRLPPGDDATFSTGDLRPTRDFIDVRDAARAVVLLSRTAGAPGAYNVGSGIETAIARVLELTLKASGRRGVRVEQTFARTSDVPRSVAEIAKLRAAGWQPAYTLEQSIADLVASFSASPASIHG